MAHIRQKLTFLLYSQASAFFLFLNQQLFKLFFFGYIDEDTLPRP